MVCTFYEQRRGSKDGITGTVVVIWTCAIFSELTAECDLKPKVS